MSQYKEMTDHGGVPVKMWTRGVPVEDEAMRQLAQLARLPIVWPHVAAMPDVHVGIGATVGSVIPTRGAIIPAAVGVDIGCGMNAMRLGLRADQLPDDLRRVRAAIERNVESYAPSNTREEVGTVTETGDGIATVEGLPSAMANELLGTLAAWAPSTLTPDEAAASYLEAARRREATVMEPFDLVHGPLVRATLLHTTILPLWPQWLERFGKLRASRIGAIPGIHFDQGLMAIEAARQGQGLVMASPLLTEDEVARGELVEPFRHRIAVTGAYYVVHPRRARLRPAAGYLKEWLLGEAGNSEIS